MWAGLDSPLFARVCIADQRSRWPSCGHNLGVGRVQWVILWSWSGDDATSHHMRRWGVERRVQRALHFCQAVGVFFFDVAARETGLPTRHKLTETSREAISCSIWGATTFYLLPQVWKNDGLKYSKRNGLGENPTNNNDSTRWCHIPDALPGPRRIWGRWRGTKPSRRRRWWWGRLDRRPKDISCRLPSLLLSCPKLTNLHKAITPSLTLLSSELRDANVNVRSFPTQPVRPVR